MPMYDDSFIGQLIPYTSYFIVVGYYLLCALGWLTVVIIIASPIIMLFSLFKSLNATKNSKQSEKLLKEHRIFQEEKYLKRLDKNVKKNTTVAC